MTDVEREPGANVAVRMYRGLLGDCFLISQESSAGSFRMLVDCGVLQCIGRSKAETKKGKARLGRAIDDLIEHTAGHLDLVVITHAHFDHVAGFIDFRDKFDKVRIDALWLAWTENDEDELARAIREHRSRGLAALAGVAKTPLAKMLGADGDGGVSDAGRLLSQARLSTIENLLQFYGDIEPTLQGPMGMSRAPSRSFSMAGSGDAPSPRSCDGAIRWLKDKVGPAAVRYLQPGEQAVTGVGGSLVANVLGPPRTEHRLTQMDPSSGSAREVYLVGRDEIAGLEATLRLVDRSAHPEAPASSMPFTRKFQRWLEPGDADPIACLYYDEQARSRRIDGEWLGTAENLALKIDGDVNNTSLVLAIELPGGDVLLFPGDAQVGNWLSWHDQDYPSGPAAKGAARTARDLLGRVVLYKAGHHMSHNATAREAGLELMTSPDLTALGPVVEKVAREQVTKTNPDGWAMPYGKLMDRLVERTRGRIIRGDGNPDIERQAFSTSRLTLGYADETGDPLWVSLTLTLPS